MTRATVKDGEFQFSSPLAKYRFFERAEGKEVKLEIDAKTTPELRKFFEGCLVPAFFYSHPHSGWKTFRDAREALKLEFSPGVHAIRLKNGSEALVAPSTTELSKTRFTRFVEAILEDMEGNGMPFEVLDAESYKKWRDSIPEEWVYPPLRRLKEEYDRERGIAS